MIGNALIPLNDMRGNMEEIRKKNLEKYQGREEILQRKISLLDCLWNDVVQFLPFHPQKTFTLQKELGLIPQVPDYKFFEINISQLDPTKTVVFFKDKPGVKNEKFSWLTDIDLLSIQDIPEATVEYYKTLIGTGELPFNYQFVPHIVHKGPVDISSADIVTLT